MEPESSLPRSQEPATAPCPQPDDIQSTICHPSSLRYILILSSYLRRGLHRSLSFRYSCQSLYILLSCPVRVTRPYYLILIDLLMQTIFGKFSFLSHSLCVMRLNTKFDFEIWGSPGSGNEEYCLLGCDIVKFGTSLSTFQRKLFPQSLGPKIKPPQKTNSNIARCLLSLPLDPEEVGNFGKHIPDYTASHHIR
jgi:hypothetical protein